MSIEAKLPAQINAMRDTAHDWVSFRPTLKHTEESLHGVLRSEVGELAKAWVLKKPNTEIELEVGDVLFATLALDNKDDRFDNHYSLILNYCKSARTTIQTLFQKTLVKNEINYPVYFFHKTSPFIDPKDSTQCLRLFRQVTKTPMLLSKYWYKLDTHLNQLPFFDAYEVTSIFRNYVKSFLLNIKGESGIVTHLLANGEWDAVPLSLNISKHQHDLIML